MIRVDVCGRTDVGRTREHNEDAYLVADVGGATALPDGQATGYAADGRGLLFMVADGMGGAAAGEIASEMAVSTVLETLAGRWQNGATVDPAIFASALREAGEEANRRIHACAAEHPEYRGMGTTATIAGLLGDTLYLAQVGDSRAYLVRGGIAAQITKDQSLMQKLVEAGELTQEEAEQSERRNIILQALGPEANIKVDLTAQQLRRGDTLVLCSDGLSGQVKPDEIARIVTDEQDLVAACRRLIDLANEHGGPDNITVIAARFEGDGLIPPGSTDPVGHRVFPLQTDSGQTPAIELRMSGGTLTTGSIPMQRRPTLEIPQPAVEPIVLRSSQSDASLARRRSRGTLIALMLLLLFLSIATWWVYRSAERIVEQRRPVEVTNPPPTQQPSP
jgi:serine/threonine protein phosphatase PrpC